MNEFVSFYSRNLEQSLTHSMSQSFSHWVNQISHSVSYTRLVIILWSSHQPSIRLITQLYIKFHLTPRNIKGNQKRNNSSISPAASKTNPIKKVIYVSAITSDDTPQQDHKLIFNYFLWTPCCFLLLCMMFNANLGKIKILKINT